MTTTETKVLDMLKEVCKQTDTEIINAEKWDDLNFNSLDIVEIILKIEDTFGIEIDDEEAEKLRNYNLLIAYLKGRNL